MSDQDRIKRLEAENERLRIGIKTATSALWSWIYSRKQRHIADIYDDLKALLYTGGCDG
jgi:hypothetical protein